MEFLLEYDKQATIEEARIFIEEEYDIKASKATVSICSAALTAFYTYDLRIAGVFSFLTYAAAKKFTPGRSSYLSSSSTVAIISQLRSGRTRSDYKREDGFTMIDCLRSVIGEKS
jgi:hypothetical protein